jgi:hypothetical protein
MFTSISEKMIEVNIEWIILFYQEMYGFISSSMLFRSSIRRSA